MSIAQPRRINEVKYCYERELLSKPALHGKVVVRLVISPAGPVAAASVARSTLGNGTVEECIAVAARRWTFPSAPQATLVTYPFVLQAAGR